MREESVAEVAKELGCDWHTVNDAVVRYGEALVDDPDRFGDVSALGLDEVLFVRRGRSHQRVRHLDRRRRRRPAPRRRPRSTSQGPDGVAL